MCTLVKKTNWSRNERFEAFHKYFSRGFYVGMHAGTKKQVTWKTILSISIYSQTLLGSPICKYSKWSSSPTFSAWSLCPRGRGTFLPLSDSKKTKQPCTNLLKSDSLDGQATFSLITSQVTVYPRSPASPKWAATIIRSCSSSLLGGILILSFPSTNKSTWRFTCEGTLKLFVLSSVNSVSGFFSVTLQWIRQKGAQG